MELSDKETNQRLLALGTSIERMKIMLEIVSSTKGIKELIEDEHEDIADMYGDLLTQIYTVLRKEGEQLKELKVKERGKNK